MKVMRLLADERPQIAGRVRTELEQEESDSPGNSELF